VTDLIARTNDALAHQTRLAWLLVFGVGVLSSVGPCAAPRVFALASLLASSKSPNRTTGAFIGGLVAVYVALGLAASMLSAVRSWVSFLNVAIMIGLVIGGFLVLRTHETHGHQRETPRSFVQIGVAGAAFGLNISPCCTPLIASIGTYTAIVGRPDLAVLYLATFGLGHAAPLFMVGMVGRRLRDFIVRAAVSQGFATVSAAVMFFLAAYYAVLIV